MAALFTKIFGRVTWEAPPWAAGLRGKTFAERVAPLRGWIARHSRAVIAGTLGFLIFFVGGLTLRSYLAHRPKPVVNGFRVFDPGLTKIEEVLHPDTLTIVFDGSVAKLADGVVVGSAIVRAADESVASAVSLASSLRAAMDTVSR